jgi:diguanylate cyclase (GGDEF)-like protein
MTLPLLFSLLFYFISAIYVYFGYYELNYDDNPNRKYVFLLLCSFLVIWSFGFSIANSAPDYDTALFWRRFSALGWGAIYSSMLHLILIITERKKILEKKWVLPLIYLPAVMIIVVFSLYSPIVIDQYNLIYTNYGWINLSTNNAWDWFSNFYYGSFTLASILLIIIWGIHSDKKNQKVAILLIVSIAIACIVSIVADVLFNTYIEVTTLQIAPVPVMLPIAAIFYSVKKYGFMKSINLPLPTQKGEILTDINRNKIYKNLTLAYLASGYLYFLVKYFFLNVDFSFALLMSLIFIIFGIAINVIHHLNIKVKNKDWLMVTILCLTILIMIFQNIEYANITIWMAPTVLMILLIPFRNRKHFLMLGVTVVTTLVLLWGINPDVSIEVNALGHLERIALVIILIAMAMYVNNIFIKRLEENDEQVQFQKMISKISADFITFNEVNYNEKITNLLEMCGRYYQVDRANLYLFSSDMKTVTFTHEWCSEGIDSIIGQDEIFQTEEIPWWMNQLKNNPSIYIGNLKQLPEEAVVEKQIFMKYKVDSILSIPVISNENLLGFLIFNTVRKPAVLIDDYIELLKIISNTLADALVKVNAEKEINYMAYYDGLTGLSNRTFFKEHLMKEIYLSKRTMKLIGVVFIDLDGFKLVNDSLGHDAGDELLREVGRRLTECVRKQDTVCRFGGDEYLVMFTNIVTVDDIHLIAKNMMKIFEKPMKIKNQELFITASSGIAMYPIDGDEPDVLIKNADLAMYTSKDSGKNKYTLCSPYLKEDVMTKMKLTNSLYRALERNELILYYQPQICIETKKIIGMEALIRWNHPELGIILPDTFIPLAEQHAELIIPIGEWVLMTACQQSMNWQKMGIPPLRIAVNLSGEQFRNIKLVDSVKQVILKTGMNPKYLELEITESIAIKGSFNSNEVLQELKDFGVSIAIDNFGIEYSSLNRLKSLPIDRIKMDIEFVHGLTKNIKDEAIAKVIIQLAKNLDLKVIAEGVETEAQLAFLTKQLCDEAQGYYYYKPMLGEEIEKILKD